MYPAFLSFLKTLDTDDNHSLVESIATAYLLAHPLVEMKDTVNWSEGMKPGQRVGKSDRNIDRAKEKSANPVTVRFHRTDAANSDAIARDGLLRNNKHYGYNTGDTNKYEPVIWTADNPDRIPVMRSVAEHPRFDSDIDTFKITMPKDVYEKSRRMKFDNGHRSGNLIPAQPGENTMANEGNYKIDVFGQDIPAKYLTRMDKTRTEDDMDEADRFQRWIHGQTKDGGTFLKSDDLERRDQKLNRTLPSRLNQNMDSVPRNHKKQLMDELSDYMVPVQEKFDWDKYNDLLSGTRLSPAEAAQRSAIRGQSKRPWNDKNGEPMHMAYGSISKGMRPCNNGRGDILAKQKDSRGRLFDHLYNNTENTAIRHGEWIRQHLFDAYFELSDFFDEYVKPHVDISTCSVDEEWNRKYETPNGMMSCNDVVQREFDKALEPIEREEERMHIHPTSDNIKKIIRRIAMRQLKACVFHRDVNDM